MEVGSFGDEIRSRMIKEELYKRSEGEFSPPLAVKHQKRTLGQKGNTHKTSTRCKILVFISHSVVILCLVAE